MSHLAALKSRLSHETARLEAATKPAEIALRKVWVAQIEREIAAELAHIDADAEFMTDDELLAALAE